LYHIVFSVKGREPRIDDTMRDRLHAYIGGTVRETGGAALAIGGVADHLHALVRWRADETVSALVRNIKANSSRWVHQTFAGHKAFAWQEGYAAFSVSRSDRDRVATYIARQEQHHRMSSFAEELAILLRSHDVEFDERYYLG
jgi:REP element-mobilizing transposase RayT